MAAVTTKAVTLHCLRLLAEGNSGVLTVDFDLMRVLPRVARNSGRPAYNPHVFWRAFHNIKEHPPDDITITPTTKEEQWMIHVL